METWPSGLRRRTAKAERPSKGAIRSNRIVSARIACSSRSLFAREGFLFRGNVLEIGRMSGTVSHLVGGEAHVVRRVQVQVLLLPPRTGVPGDSGYPLAGASLGQG